VKCVSRDFKLSLWSNLWYTFFRARLLSELGNSTHFLNIYFMGGGSSTKFWDNIQPSSTLPQCVLCLGTLLCFGTGMPQKPKWGHISKYLTPSKNSRGAGKLCEIKPRSVIVAIVRCLRFPIFCSVLKPELVKCDWCRKWRQNFALFDPRVKFRGEVGKISELILPVLPRTKPQIYFWRGAAWPSRKWESGHGCQNRKDAKREILQAIVGWP